ncbi:MAG: hypothetical protein ABJC66_01050 [Gammaproteobacteria bacterium]
MPLFWFIAGILTTLACLVLLVPWLRTIPRFSALPAVSKPVSFGGVFVLVLVLGLYAWLGRTDVRPGSPMGPTTGVSKDAAGSFASAANLMNAATGESAITPISLGGSANGAGTPGMKPGSGSPGAESMESAIASLESRLVKGGGSADDWELLAKSFEFLGRSADAAKARAHQLPASGFESSGGIASASATPAAGAAPTTAASGAALSGEVAIAPKLSSKAAAGETLFIVAKSVDSPGIPVAVLRTSVGAWPMKFTLDDSLSMMPGRNLSSAGRVTVEARISQKGQAMPASGDLQGSTGVINPRDHQPLKLVIDRVIS